MGFIFGGNTGQSYEDIQAKRKIAEQLLQQNASTPRNVGEGLSAIGRALAYRNITKKADAADATNKAAFDQQYSGLFAGSSGGSAPSFAPVDPNSPEGIGDATMVALGKAPDFAKLESTYGLPSGYLSRTAQLESGGNPNAQNPNSSAGGMFQFIDSTAKQYGLTDKTDPIASADAAARLAADNKAYLTKALGREPSAGELYLAHQQGPAGAAKLILNQGAPAASLVGNDAVALNGGSGGMTGGDFAQKWLAKFGGEQPQSGSGMSIQALAEVAGSPYATPGQKAVAAALLQQQMDAADPAKKLALEKAQLEVQQMQNPQAQVPEMVTQRLMLAKQAGLQPGTPEYSTYMATGELPGAGGSDTPAAFASLDLQAQAAGFKPGTPEYQEFMRNGGGSGAPAAFVALDLQAKAAGFQPGTPAYQEFMATRGAGLIAEAKLKGADVALLDSQSSKMAGLEAVVSELNQLADKATYTGAGQAYDSVRAQLGMEPREAAIARAEYIAKVDNQVLPMLRDTFGAAFTVKEGESLRATLGDPNKTPAEKKAVLSAFIEQKKRDIAALQTRTGKAPEAAGAPADDAEYLKSLGLE